MFSTNNGDDVSDVSDPSGPFFAVWGSDNPDHHVVATSQNQANTLSNFFVSLNLPLTHITMHNSKMAAELYLATQTEASAEKLNPSVRISPDTHQPLDADIKISTPSVKSLPLPSTSFNNTIPTTRSIPAVFSAPQ